MLEINQQCIPWDKADGANFYSEWTTCSKSCGTGTQTRTNTCAIITEGLQQSCNTQDCCSDSTTSYGSWSSCDKKCGTGSKSRTVTVTSNYDGSVCSTTTETESCNTQSCCTVKHYTEVGTYCGNAATNMIGSYSAWDDGKLEVCTGNGTGCVTANTSGCNKIGGTYFYFKYCP